MGKLKTIHPTALEAGDFLLIKVKKFYKFSLDFDFLQCYSECKKKGLTDVINNH